MIKEEVQTNHTGFARALKINEKQLAVPSDEFDISIFDLTESSFKRCQKLSFFGNEPCGQLMSMMTFNFSTDTTYLLAGYESGHLVKKFINK